MASDNGKLPITSFFPSIDRSLLDDLDRHLRGVEIATGGQNAEQVKPSTEDRTRHVFSVVEAVESVAKAMSTTTGRVKDLEEHVGDLETRNQHLEAQLAAANEALQAAETKLAAETQKLAQEAENAAKYERVATYQTSRVLQLEQDLSAADADFASVRDAITEAFQEHLTSSEAPKG